ncbi:MAG: Gfo/Idh/MocA family protein [Butyricicoccus sp.]
MYYGEKRVENPIRWGMVGGGRGSQIGYIHRSAALRDFNFELVAGAFDIDPERGKDFGKQLHVDPDRCYPDYKTMFAEEAKRPDGVQAVSIATPNGMHYEVCKAALEAGLHVVCEKPLCFTSEQADELVKLAEEKHRVVGVTYGYSGHQRSSRRAR